MKKFNCIIIEDEPLAMERTQSYASKIPYLNTVGCFEDALEGLAYLQTHPVDVLFLDINMDELSGIELLESTQVKCEVIITTAYPQYALKGFELKVTDYLLKPFTFNRFLQAVNKAQDNLTKNNLSSELEFIFVKTENRLEKIVIADILFIEGMRDYRRIHTHDKKVMTLQKFSELETLIPPKQVCRVHKSYMVNIKKIDAIERGRILLGPVRIPISATYRDEFFNQINTQ